MRRRQGCASTSLSRCRAPVVEGHPGHSGAEGDLPGYGLFSNIDTLNTHLLVHFSGHDVLIFIQVKGLRCWLKPDAQSSCFKSLLFVQRNALILHLKSVKSEASIKGSDRGATPCLTLCGQTAGSPHGTDHLPCVHRLGTARAMSY